MARIAIIGGGSAYMPGLAFSFARESQRFAGSTLVLYDLTSTWLTGHCCESRHRSRLQRRPSRTSSGSPPCGWPANLI